jgi:hypothetical protein
VVAEIGNGMPVWGVTGFAFGVDGLFEGVEVCACGVDVTFARGVKVGYSSSVASGRLLGVVIEGASKLEAKEGVSRPAKEG